MRHLPKKYQNEAERERDAHWRSWAPPAAVDINAYGRRAGEFIARAARALREGPRDQNRRKRAAA